MVMRAVVYRGPGEKAWGRMCGTLRSRTALTLLSGLTPPRFAVPTYIFSRATCRPSDQAESSVTRLSALSSRSATA
jgi:hypothetical protein